MRSPIPPGDGILQSLKEHGGCSIGKDVGLCASDIEQRIHLSQSTISHHMAVLTRAGVGGSEENWPVEMVSAERNRVSEFARPLKKRL